jgi:hypothetical protein
MNKINFLEKADFPMDSNTMDFLQNMTKFAAELAKLGGDNYILSGCEETGDTVADGLIVCDGELLRFRGGTKSDRVHIKSETTQVNNAGEIYNAYTERWVGFVDSGLLWNNIEDSSLLWSDFRRIKNLCAVGIELPKKATITNESLEEQRCHGELWLGFDGEPKQVYQQTFRGALSTGNTLLFNMPIDRFSVVASNFMEFNVEAFGTPESLLSIKEMGIGGSNISVFINNLNFLTLGQSLLPSPGGNGQQLWGRVEYIITVKYTKIIDN